MVTYSLSRGSASLDLSVNEKFYVLPGVEGLDTPPVRLSSVDPVEMDGSIITNVRYAPRQIFLPLHMQAATTDESRARTRALAAMLNPQLGPVTLTVTHPATSSSQLLSAAAVNGETSAWEAGNIATTVSHDTGIKRTGSGSLKVVLTGVISGDGYIGAKQPSAQRLTVAPGQSYLLQFYARSASGTRTARGIINYYAGSTLLSSVEFSGSVTTTWKKIAGATSPPLGATKAEVELAGARGTGETLYFDDITFTGQTTTREISGYLSESIGSALRKVEGLPWRRFGLTLTCPDPFFLGPTEAAISPFVTSATINNPGDAVAWPVWTILMASGYPVTVTNTSITGSPSWTFDDDPYYGSTTINTDPRSLSAKSGSTNVWGNLSAASVLWPLLPGNNALTGVNLGGAPLSSVSVSGTFRPRWLTAW